MKGHLTHPIGGSGGGGGGGGSLIELSMHTPRLVTPTVSTYTPPLVRSPSTLRFPIDARKRAYPHTDNTAIVVLTWFVD